MSKNRADVPIKKILVAVDGSKSSLDAAEQATRLAEKYGADLIAVYVISSDIRYDVISSDIRYDVISSGIRYGHVEDSTKTGLSSPFKEIVNIAIEKGQKCVEEVKERASDMNVKVQTEVRIAVSSVVREIVEYAEKQNVDLIVIGTRGMSGIKRMLLGSTASGVVTYSHCPVLVVK